MNGVSVKCNIVFVTFFPPFRKLKISQVIFYWYWW